MVRHQIRRGRYRCRSPHTRGDGPTSEGEVGVMKKFSPHAWGWSDTLARYFENVAVLPTRVGMVRIVSRDATRSGSSPHTRGDGPFRLYSAEERARFSPHAWGWSGTLARTAGEPSFSPHAWGWSDRLIRRESCENVLPTRVGMVRASELLVTRLIRFSPHAWGWSD